MIRVLFTTSGLFLVVCLSTATLPAQKTQAAKEKQPTKKEQQPKGKEDPAHEELRALRGKLVDAIGKVDVEALLALCDKDVVLTAQHGEVAHGHDGLKKYMEKMMTGPNNIVKSYSVDPTVDTLSILHGGDTAIAYGSSKDRFVLTNGTEFALDCRWTATLVKKDGKWLVAGLHSSANVLDNAILNNATSWIFKAAAIAGVVGILLGVVFMVAVKRSKPAPANKDS